MYMHTVMIQFLLVDRVDEVVLVSALLVLWFRVITEIDCLREKNKRGVNDNRKTDKHRETDRVGREDRAKQRERERE